MSMFPSDLRYAAVRRQDCLAKQCGPIITQDRPRRTFAVDIQLPIPEAITAPLTENKRRRRVKTILRTLRRDQRGATAIEYALIVGLMAALLIGVLSGFSDKLSGLFTAINDRLEKTTQTIKNTTTQE
jgi:pilus assembly protein Flp/PilA